MSMSDAIRHQNYTNSGIRWQVVAFRAVRDGDLETIQALCEQQPVLLHDRFTHAMEDWELEYESLKWYQFRDTTCLFIASASCPGSTRGPCHVFEWLSDKNVE